MGKWLKDAVKKLEKSSVVKYASNLLEDKRERAESCAEYLARNNINICNTQTGSKLTFNDVSNVGIGRFDPLSESYDHYCKSELRNKGYVDCKTLKSGSDLADDIKLQPDISKADILVIELAKIDHLDIRSIESAKIFVNSHLNHYMSAKKCSAHSNVVAEFRDLDSKWFVCKVIGEDSTHSSDEL